MTGVVDFERLASNEDRASMATSHCGSEASQWDPDLTPRPLRIVKRKSQRGSRFVNTSQRLSTASMEKPHVPIRISSASSNNAISETHPQRETSRASQWSVSSAPLCMNKQRASDIPYVGTAVNTASGDGSGFSSLKSPRYLPNQVSYTVTDQSQNDISTRNGDSSTIKLPNVRAVTTGTMLNPTSLSSAGISPTAQAPPVPLSQRRAMTGSAPIPKPVSTQHANNHVMHKQSSLKRGFISRVMSGLTHRSHNSPVTSIHPRTGKGRANDVVLSSQNLSPEITPTIKRISESSAATMRSNDSDFEDPMAAFPTPPTSSNTSPRHSDPSSITQSVAQRYRSLSKPGEATIMGAGVILTPEIDKLNADDGANILVSIDVEGLMSSSAGDQELQSQHNGLDIVVIIDNS